MVASGVTLGDRVEVRIGVPGAFTTLEPLVGNPHLGRFNALLAEPDRILLLSVRDALDAALRPAPAALLDEISL